jgi:hypothetical protein
MLGDQTKLATKFRRTLVEIARRADLLEHPRLITPIRWPSVIAST